LAKLKDKVGNVDDFVKAARMLNDYNLRPDLSSKFADFMKGKKMPKCSVTPLLCSSNWPVNIRPQNFQLSRTMEGIFNAFKEYYATVASKRTVSLLHQYGKGEISFYTDAKEYTLLGGEYQLTLVPMITLEGVTMKHIMDESRLTLEEVKYQLNFLIKHKLVTIDNGEDPTKATPDDPKTWLPASVLKVNRSFKNPAVRFTLALTKEDKEAARKAAGGASAPAESLVTQQEARQIFADYVMRTECIIVRVMKTRKTGSNTEVFGECASQLSRFFPLTEKIFKGACEKLIDENIIKRSSKDSLEYLA